jgi:hypothetical protein
MNVKSGEYKEYLASREWAVLREKVRERSNNKCERCREAPQEAVHHLTYERIGHELLEDLQAVCNSCHEFVSGKRDTDPAACDLTQEQKQRALHLGPTELLALCEWHFRDSKHCVGFSRRTYEQCCFKLYDLLSFVAGIKP